ncbi:hypothetical protein BGW36DRAFT_375661 [Talaromyces proteolyticus]|uniref:Inner membrane assembly complex subunit 17 n=1 Tax=Talaromyces proteolyticus TaxID=1131652 RepID=A0AAD4KUI7_9EURO|nr:uncharacterized protein BGW36DRAFT_375661 [Talaromyces proteolyticus]KAH8701143.1 hypothetical protein BGW36DRAFT_375661 [Talaromyces proteolyticus]
MLLKSGLRSTSPVASLARSAQRTCMVPNRTFTSSACHFQQTEQTSSFKEGASAFRPFGRPFAKVFLGAIFTYQVIYWGWSKLEASEKKLLKNEEVRSLEKQAKELAAKTK